MTQSDVEKHRGEAIAWMLRLEPGTATTDDIAAFKEWRQRDVAHAEAFAEVRGLWEAIGPAGRGVFDPSALEAFAPSRARRGALGRRAFLGGAMAASVAAAACAAIRPPLDLWPSLAEMNADYRTAVGEQRRVALGDDVAIEMNTRTSIALLPRRGAVARVELIAGESAVSTLSHALEVTAGEGCVLGAGATFNIRRDGDEVRLICLDGEVRVVHGAMSIVLGGRRQLAYSSMGLGPVSLADAITAASWRDGFLVFHDARLDEVVAEINRYRRGRIVIAGGTLGGKTVNGRFYLARLDEVVEKFQNAFGAHVTSLPGGIVILS